MGTLWFVLLSFMLIVYVLLDGFDLGTGILHLLVADTDEERRTVIAAIGPVWGGNEVWLVAFGGLLVFAFPKVYAAAASGFYLPIMMVLWLLVIRGVAIEFRNQQANPLWRAFWDTAFAASSALLAVLFGVALGDLLRGLPVDETGYFRGPLFGDFRPESASGALDWYTLTVGIFAALVLAGHAALYLCWKTAGVIRERCGRAARGLWWAIAVTGPLMLLETAVVQPGFAARLSDVEAVFAPLWMVASLVAVLWLIKRGAELAAFVASSAFLAGLLAAALMNLYPAILRSTIAPRYDLTVANAAAGRSGLVIGLAWWIPAIALAIGYFVYLYRSFRGKVTVSADGHY
jgi:cytochrome bd ubiquinol oxidase subunit II